MAARTFRETLNGDQFIITADACSIKGSDTTRMIDCIGLLRDKAHALNAADNKSAVMRYPSLGQCVLIKELGGEPLLNMTCRDRNRLALQSDLLFAWSRGIGAVLCLPGDSIDMGEDRQAKAVSDLDCAQLIGMVRALNAGRDMAGNELTGKTDFCVGATVASCARQFQAERDELSRKLDAGVDFIVTNAVYDIDDLKRTAAFVKARDRKVKVLAGILPLVSIAMARFMNSNMPGVFVPESVISELAQAPGGKAMAVGITLSAKLIGRLRDERICDGVHIMFPGREERIADVIESAGLAPAGLAGSR